MSETGTSRHFTALRNLVIVILSPGIGYLRTSSHPLFAIDQDACLFGVALQAGLESASFPHAS